jgi:hypothetical protein
VRVYRVLHCAPGAAPRDPGGALFIPRQGGGRIDNPADYEVLYVGDSQAGVCAEVFNRGKYRKEWNAEMLRGLPSIPGSRRVLAWYEIPAGMPICDLDDPNVLVARSLRPSNIITRDYAQSQAWAMQVFTESRWAGVRWWSYHDARWASLGLWSRDAIADFGYDELTIDHPAIIEAASVLSIRIRHPRRKEQ